jgi:hypothetical protein
MGNAIDRLETQLVAALRQNLATRKPVAIPEAGRLLWQIFGELSATRTYHQAGPNPVSHAEILTYGQAMRWPLQPHHVAILRTMDDAYLDHAYSGRGKAPDGMKTLPHISQQPLSAALIDAVLG